MMSDEKSKERYQKLYVPGETSAAAHQNASKDKERILSSLSDCLIVHKIAGSESGLKESESLLDENEIHNLETAELHEKKNLAVDYEAIVKKQLQILQADERGKQALQNEIADIKKQQQKRSEALKARKKALLVEKERAKRIASRPPPLPRSVIMLLKEHEKKESELSALDEVPKLPHDYVEEENDYLENKENVLDEKELEERRKLQEERDIRAKKRFNEAIKKEHQKQEHAEILREIENAEKLNRRQLAKTVSVKGGRVPCTAPDGIFHAAQQVAMEDKVENIFQKNPKEHAVEDLEGYEDYWETKYTQIDSKMEEKMIDCVPSFVKENYEYLLEDESSLRCGKRFSGLDESRDEFNTAYIDSPPCDEELQRSKHCEETEAIINHLHQMQKEINETIEKEFKPLLEAKDVPKTESVDKAVGTDILKFPTEHKAVGVQSDSPKDRVSVESKSVGVDLMSGGVMGFKRDVYSSRFKMPAHIGSTFASPEEKKPDLGKAIGQESWSSSSYWSLPSKHGLPNVCNLCDSPNCNIPLVEHKNFPNSCIPLSKSRETPSSPVPESRRNTKEEMPPQNNSVNSSNNTLTSGDQSKLSYYVQMVADKYLKNKSNKSTESSDGISNEPVRKHFVLESVENKENQIDSVTQKSLGKYSFWEDEPIMHKTSGESSRQNFIISDQNTSTEMPVNLNPVTASSKTLQHSIYQVSERKLPENSVFSAEKNVVIAMNDSTDDVFVQKCHEVISDNLSGIFSHPKEAKTVASGEVCHSVSSPVSIDVAESNKDESAQQPYVYHELSTIQEMDSALTNDGNRSSYSTSKRSLGSSGNVSNKSEKTANCSDPINTTPISLVDVPPDEVSELAKSIRFIKKASPKKAEQVSRIDPRAPQIFFSGSPSLAQTIEVGTLSSVATTNASELSSTSSLVSNHGTLLTLKTAEYSSGSCGPLTPSLQSAQHSPLSIGSQEILYAPAFSSPFKNQYHPTTPASLPKYFPDISSIRQGSSSSCSSQYGGSQSSKTVVDNLNLPLDWTDNKGFNTLQRMQTNRDGSSSDSFKPMTPHTNLPSPSETYSRFQVSKEESSSGSFKPMTPHSSLSSPSTAYSRYQSPAAGSSKDIQPVTERSPQKSNVMVAFGSPDSSSSQFYPLTPRTYPLMPHSYTSSSLNPKEESVLRNSIQGNVRDIPRNYSPLIRDPNHQKSKTKNSYSSAESGSGFQPLTAHSDFPSQSSQRGLVSLDPIEGGSEFISPDPFKVHMKKRKSPADLRLKVLHSLKSSSESSFQPLSPRSGISVSSVKSFMEQNLSADVVLPNDPSVCKPVKFKLNYKAQNFSNPENDSAQYMVGDGSHSQLRLPHPQDIKIQGLESGSTGGIVQKPGSIGKSLQKSSERKSPKAAKACGSEFFNPQLSATELGHFKAMQSTESLIEGSLQDSEICTPIAKLKKHPKAAKACRSEFFEPKLSASDFSHFKGMQSEGLIEGSLQDSQMQPLIPKLGEYPKAVKKCGKNKDNLIINPTMAESPKMFQKPAASLSSNNSPNLILEALKKKLMSDVSGNLSSQCRTPSMITHHSTPTKTIEEMIQETGILDEPDLTLVNTNYTIKPDSPERQRNFTENSRSFSINAALSDNNFSLVNSAKNAVIQGLCDSPSMLSFLQHERSCVQDSQAGTATSPMPTKKTPRSDYKTRTKRLWNNLEEVRKRKLMEEKRDQLLKNRLKMKTYSKKLTTPKKKS